MIPLLRHQLPVHSAGDFLNGNINEVIAKPHDHPGFYEETEQKK